MVLLWFPEGGKGQLGPSRGTLGALYAPLARTHATWFARP